jgi:hypothetical protein
MPIDRVAVTWRWELDDRCILELCDPDGLPMGEAIRLARQVSAVEPALVPHLTAFIDYLCGYSYLDPRVMERALELMRAISDAKSFARLCDRREGVRIRW